jgi:hypothetical protein
LSGCLGSEHAGLTFDAEVAVEAAMLATARRRSLTQALFAVEAGLECALRTSLVLRFGGHQQYAAYLAPPGWAHNVYAFAKYSRSTSSILSISSVLL